MVFMVYKGNKEKLDLFLSLYTTVGNKEDCWLWNGPVDKTLGYGRTSFLGYPSTAHAAVHMLAYGDHLKTVGNKNIHIRHLCGNRLCINPNHLALGTPSDNGRDASREGKWVKMTKDKLIIALKMRKEGVVLWKIGEALGITGEAVSNALRGKTYISGLYLKELGVKPMKSEKQYIRANQRRLPCRT